MSRRPDDWYNKKLQKYFNNHYDGYEMEAEWLPDPAPNVWRFLLPNGDAKICITLTCYDTGEIEEEESIIDLT